MATNLLSNESSNESYYATEVAALGVFYSLDDQFKCPTQPNSINETKSAGQKCDQHMFANMKEVEELGIFYYL